MHGVERNHLKTCILIVGLQVGGGTFVQIHKKHRKALSIQKPLAAYLVLLRGWHLQGSRRAVHTLGIGFGTRRTQPVGKASKKPPGRRSTGVHRTRAERSRGTAATGAFAM